MVARIGPPPKPPLTQWALTSVHEGVVPHLYLDTRGNVTCGVGFLVRTVSALAAYPWHPSVATARGDWAELHRPDVLSGRMPDYYRKICCARLTTEGMRAVFEDRVLAFRAALETHWQLSRQPEDVQLALVDMAYQLGAVGLRRFVKLHAAVMARDYRTAMYESYRRDASPTRNANTAKLFEAAALAV